MTQRTAKLASAIFASLVASAAFVTASHSAPVEADKCLSGPKGAPPAGGHWYYRVDRATKRPCWYIGDAKAKVSRAAPGIPPQTANPVSPPNDAGTQLSIANARAELPLPQARRAPEATALTGQPAAEAASPTDSRPAHAEDANAPRSVVASRWFEPTSMASSAPSQSAAAATRPQPISEAAPPPKAAATLRLAAADPSAARSSGTIQQLLIAIVGALTLAGLLASAIFRLSRARRSRRRNSKMSVNRSVNWDLAGIGRPTLPDDAGGAASWRDVVPLPKGSLPRDPRPASDPDERIGQMLTRLARSNAT